MCDFDELEPGSKADQAERWLGKYLKLKAKVLQLDGAIADNEAMADGIRGIDYSRDPVQTSPTDDAMMRRVESLGEVRESLQAIRDEAAKSMRVMEKAVGALPDPMHSAVLCGHYINGRRWEELCNEDSMACSYRTMMRRRKAALESLYDLDLIPHTERLPRVPAL